MSMETMEIQPKDIELSTIFPDPGNPLEIKIPLFEGPLDLLLHLIRKKEVSIAEVRLSELTASYLEYLEKLQYKVKYKTDYYSLQLFFLEPIQIEKLEKE